MLAVLVVLAEAAETTVTAAGNEFGGDRSSHGRRRLARQHEGVQVKELVPPREAAT